jgi:hypothetical protein
MNIKKRSLVIANTVTFAVMLFINYASNAHVFAGATVADVAHKYDILFAPADYAFIIWAVIFLLCAGFIVYEWVLLKDDRKQYIQRTGIWFMISNIANALWIYCWVNEWLGSSVVVISILLISLIMLTINLRLELDDEPVLIIFFVWWPISFYLGWIMVATIACIASWLVSIQWNGFGILPDVWSIIMIVIAFLVYVFLNQARNMRETVTVGIWAFVAIAVHQWNMHKNIAIAAITAAVILFILIAIHGYKNHYYAPLAKIKRNEWK